MVDDQIQVPEPAVDPAFQIGLIRRRFLESVSAVLVVLVIVGLPLSLSRIYRTGMNFNHVSHICDSIVILSVFWFRKRLSDRWLVSLLLLIFTSLSLVAFLRYGIVSAGYYFAASCIFVAGMALGLRGGFICAAFYSLAISIIAWLWMSGRLIFPGDAREYVLMPVVWSLLSIAFIITTGVFFVSATGLFSGLRNLVDTINRQKLEIEKQAGELVRTNGELAAALSEVKTLSGLLPICARCKKIRDDEGYWKQIEEYVQRHTDVSFSHDVCPECAEELYGGEEWYQKWKRKQ